MSTLPTPSPSGPDEKTQTRFSKSLTGSLGSGDGWRTVASAPARRATVELTVFRKESGVSLLRDSTAVASSRRGIGGRDGVDQEQRAEQDEQRERLKIAPGQADQVHQPVRRRSDDSEQQDSGDYDEEAVENFQRDDLGCHHPLLLARPISAHFAWRLSVLAAKAAIEIS